MPAKRNSAKVSVLDSALPHTIPKNTNRQNVGEKRIAIQSARGLARNPCPPGSRTMGSNMKQRKKEKQEEEKKEKNIVTQIIFIFRFHKMRGVDVRLTLLTLLEFQGVGV